MNQIREDLRQLLITRSLQIGHFTLTSGMTSTHYIDAKKTTLDPEGAYLCARLILDELARNQVEAEAIGGLTLGADPVVGAVAAVSFGERDRYTPLSAFIVRKEAKKHGTQLYIEGFEGKKGSRIVIFDDVCTTNGGEVGAYRRSPFLQWNRARRHALRGGAERLEGTGAGDRRYGQFERPGHQSGQVQIVCAT